MDTTTTPLTLSETYVRSYDDLNTKRDAFIAKVTAGIAKKEDILFYILTIDEAGHETMPSSMGMDWLHSNPEEFAKIVGNVDEFIDWMLVIGKFSPNEAAIQESYWVRYTFLSSFLRGKKLMALLSPAWRERMVREIYPIVGSINDYWISAAILSGVSRKVIATAILNQLNRVKIVAGCNNGIDNFLRHGGAGPNEAPIHVALRSLGVDQSEIDRLCKNINNDPSKGIAEIEKRLAAGIVPTETHYSGFPSITPWWILNNEELKIAFTICAQKSPGETLNVMDDKRITQRLDETAQRHIVSVAAMNMTSLNGTCVEKLNQLFDTKCREVVARCLKPLEKFSNIKEPTAQFLFQIFVQLPEEQHEEFWTNVIVPVLKEVSTTILYRVWSRTKLVDNKIETTLRNWLASDGFLIGSIIRGKHPKGGDQFMVEHNGIRYIHETQHHRYHPSEGDLVMFNTPNGKYLTPRVVAVYFTPVLKDI